MKAEKITLGKTCLDNYVIEQAELSAERKKELDELIQQREEGGVLNIERFLLRSLKLEKTQLPTIDPCFLSIPNFIDYKGQQIQVPKFSVYNKIHNGFDPFIMNIISDSFLFSYENRVKFCNGDLAKLLTNQLIKSTEFWEASKPSENNRKYYDSTYYFYGPRKLWKKYKKINYITLKNHFHAAIPKEKKQKIKEFNEIFDDNLYLIAETKPKDWFSTRFVKDLLLIGVFKDKCYLVDYFETESIEDKIKNEFKI